MPGSELALEPRRQVVREEVAAAGVGHLPAVGRERRILLGGCRLREAARRAAGDVDGPEVAVHDVDVQAVVGGPCGHRAGGNALRRDLGQPGRVLVERGRAVGGTHLPDLAVAHLEPVLGVEPTGHHRQRLQARLAPESSRAAEGLVIGEPLPALDLGLGRVGKHEREDEQGGSDALEHRETFHWDGVARRWARRLAQKAECNAGATLQSGE
jgi:hypothetical protein